MGTNVSDEPEDPVPSEPVFYGRRDTKHHPDDYEPLRYGVIPQYHNFDMAWANVHHWYYMLFVQTRRDGILAPFSHWTPGKGVCPPLSAKSKLNTLNQPQSNPLHLGWTVYAVVQFIFFVLASGHFMGSNHAWVQNFLEGCTSQAILTSDGCQQFMERPITFVYAQPLGAVLVTVGYTCLALWTMSNIGKIFNAAGEVHKERLAKREELVAAGEKRQSSLRQLEADNDKKQLVLEEVMCQNWLLRIEGLRHAVVCCLGLALGDAALSAQWQMTSSTTHICCAYVCLQLTFLISVWWIGTTRKGAESALARRLRV